MAKFTQSGLYPRAVAAQNSAPPTPESSPGIALAERLRQAVRAAGGNQAVAARSGVPLATVNNYVRGRHGMKIEPLAALAAASGVSLQWLVTGESDRNAAFTPADGPTRPGLAETQADLAPDGLSGNPDVAALAKAIDIVRAVAGDAALQADAETLARRIAAAYAVLVKPSRAGC